MLGRTFFLIAAILALFIPAIALGQDSATWEKKSAPIMTRWSEDVVPERVLPEYPRPQMRRDEWLNLNGLWGFEMASEDDAPPAGMPLSEEILVPFPIESALSGVMEPADRAWYRRTFEVPSDWNGRRVLIHFGAVDWEAEVFVNGQNVGMHRGGYDGFSFDITDALANAGEQELLVRVYDPTDEGVSPRGKQVGDPGGIFYTAVTGIWQTVWLEPVNEAHIANLRLVPDIGRMALSVSATVEGASPRQNFRVTAMDEGRQIAVVEGEAGDPLEVPVASTRLWTPEDPALYDLKVELVEGDVVVDAVDSYFGMRSIEVGKDSSGVTRMLLNGDFVFQIGPLDQGYWPDGLYTAPTDEALRFDIEAAKEAGFNMIRKHAKVEPQRWYYWTDRLGMLVWQDMPSVNPDDFEQRQTAEHRDQFEGELEQLVVQHFNHPSIVMWTVFNEAWGQYDTERLTNWTKELDPTRLVTNASGWTDYPVGDIIDMHAYPGPGAFPPEESRASVLGEFGGLGLPVPGHTWAAEDNWGYQAFTTREELTERYERLYDDLWPLMDDPGLSAAVYTQITDVETETNGLLTYDREVWKIDPEKLRSLHRPDMVSYPRLSPDGTLFLDSIVVEMDNRGGETIRYTLDGSAPGPEAPIYSEPLTLRGSAIVRARSFSGDGRTSGVASSEFTLVDELRAAEPDISGLASGVAYELYRGEWEQLPDFTAETATETGTTANINLNDQPERDHFGMRFTGFVEAPADGVYTFYTESDDGSQLFIGDKMIVNNDGVHGMAEERGQIALSEGWHPITVTFFEGVLDEGLVVRYEGPGIEKQEVPAAALRHRP